MLGFVVLGVICLVATVLVTGHIWFNTGEWFETIFTLFLCLLISTVVTGAFGSVLAALTTGAIPDYSEGVREGYITKLSVKGYIWKTNEGEIQVGAGEMAALQEPFAFCCPDEQRFQLLKDNLGKRVRLHYSQWLIAPWPRCEGDYEITSVELIPEVAR